MPEESTTALLNILSHTSSEEIDKFCKEHLDKSGSIIEYFNNFTNPDKGGISPAAVAKNCAAYMSKSYVYDLLNGQKSNPSRDKLLLICFSLHMNSKQTRRTLEMFGHRPLYPKDKRDMIISICINEKIWDIDKVNEKLATHGEIIFPYI